MKNSFILMTGYIFKTNTLHWSSSNRKWFKVINLRIEEPPKVLTKEEEKIEEEEEGFNPFKSILPSFFYSNKVVD